MINLGERIRRDWNAPKNERVQSACGDAKLVVEFVARYFHSAEVSAVMRTALRQDNDFVEAFEMIHGTVDEFGGCLAAIGQAGHETNLVETLEKLADDLRQWLEEAVSAFVAVVDSRAVGQQRLATDRSNALRVATDVRSELSARRFVHQAERALGETRRVRDQTMELAGEFSAGKSSLHYDSYARSEFKTANRLRSAVVALLLGTALAVVALNIWLEELSLGAELLRLSVTIPIAVLAGYLVRESSKHRATAIWARELAIAMHTITTYIQPLDEAGVELRRVLGLRAFGSGADRVAASGDLGLYDDLADAVSKAEGILHRVNELLERRSKP
ncbi:hypothetical protein AB0F15_00535 [Amycolatopsis sp. NPDC026612]|uniref:hypothetical protein n=1 Tax=Amycolatopsis sp. NPDC026612 TaxID=3155466 RepID=UPI0033C7AE59